MKYLSYAVGIIVRPSRTLSALVSDPDRFKVGLFGVLALGVLYGGTELLLYVQGIQPAGKPFLNIPVEKYYLYEGFFNLPVSLAGWLLMGSTIYLTVPGSDVSYSDLLGVIGLPYGILVLPLMWLPETVLAVGWPSEWTAGWWTTLTVFRVVLGTLWVYVGCTLAVKRLYGLSLIRSCMHTLAGLAVGIGTSVIFIR